MRLRRLARYDALLLTAGIWFLAKFLRYAFPPLFATFRGEFGVSTALVGTAFSALMVAYAAMQFPSGALADRLGPVTVITAGALVTGAGALSLLVEGPFPVLVAGMVLVGLGTGAHKTVAVRLLAMVYPARTGRAIGVLDTLAAFGGVAAPAAVILVLPDWRGLFLAGGLAAVSLAVLFRGAVPRRLPPEPADAGDGDDDGFTLRRYLGILRQPRVAVFVGVTVAVAFSYNGAVAFLPLFLVESAGLPPTTANAIYGAVFVASLVQLGTGELADRAGQLPVLLVAVAAATAGLFALLFVSGTLAVGIAVVVFGLGGHGYRPLRSAYLVAVLPAEAAGGGLGAVRTILMSAAAVAPAVTGFLVQTAGYGVAFGVLGGSMAVAGVLVAGLLATE